MEKTIKIKCPKCQNTEHHKYGFKYAEQRYRCKTCKYQFQESTKPQKNTEIKKQAIELYMTGLSFRSIGKIIGTSNVTVLRWVRSYAEQDSSKPEVTNEPIAVELDEMWHYIGSKKTNYGYGKRIVEQQKDFSIGNVENEIPRR